MKIEDQLKGIRKRICNILCVDLINDYDEQIKEWRAVVREQSNTYADLEKDYFKEVKKVNDLIVQRELSRSLLINQNHTPVDIWCTNAGLKPVRKVYKDKIIINNVKMPCDLREIFTPTSYLIQKARKDIIKSNSKLQWYKNITKYVHKKVEWTTDGRYDNYYYPNYTLSTGQGDCDDSAFLQMSIEPELANAFGFYKAFTGKKIGHSFAVGIVDNKLWVFDAVGNEVVPYHSKKNTKYTINYIITKNQVYVMDGSVEFGSILW